MEVLLDWLTTEGNYAKWKGDSLSGPTKEALIGVILDKLKEVGIHRKSSDVRDKIRYLENQYHRATDWLANADQKGIDDNSVRVAIFQLCPCYYQLTSVMANNSPSESCQTTDNLGANSDQRIRKRSLTSNTDITTTSNKRRHPTPVRILSQQDAPIQPPRDSGNTTLLEERRLELEMKREVRILPQQHAASQPPSDNGNAALVEPREPSPQARGNDNSTLLEERLELDMRREARIHPQQHAPSQLPRGNGNAALVERHQLSPQARGNGNTTLLKLEKKRLELEMRREAREEAQAKAEVELIHAKRRSVEIGNTTRLLLAKKQLKNAGYTEEELAAHLPLNT